MRLYVMLAFCLIVALAVVHAAGDARNDKSETDSSPGQTRKARKLKTSGNTAKSRSGKDGTKKTSSSKVKSSTDTKRPSKKSGPQPVRERKSKMVENQRRSNKRKPKTEGCPGVCMKTSLKCASRRLLKNKCQKGYKCCLDRAARSYSPSKRTCSPLDPCNDLTGECKKHRIGCPDGQVPYKNTKKVKYCSKKSCVCCAASPCPPKCTDKGGVCQSLKEDCSGKLKKGKSWCGKDCGCCIIKGKSCKTKHACEEEDGKCQPTTEECDGSLKEGKNYCKGKGCGCCVPKPEVEWSYSGEKGPEFWSQSFPICGMDRQSPINIVTDKVEGDFKWLHFGFKNYGTAPTTMKLFNNGHTAQVEIVQNPVPTVQGGGLDGKYNFLQFHYHWGSDNTKGSEHTVDGKRYPAELHLVHYKAEYGSVAEAVMHDDGLAVLGIFIEVTAHNNPKVQSLIDGLASIRDPKAKVDIKPFPLENLLPNNRNEFFRYLGSLTTPPCNEIVIWTVFKQAISMSDSQLAEFRKLIDVEWKPMVDNFRPVQPLGSRKVFDGDSVPHWSYDGDTGPDNWVRYFPTCGGSSQSPIDIVTRAVKPTLVFPFLFFNYDKLTAKATLVNNGHTARIDIEMPPGVAIPTITGGNLPGKYTFLQFHLHWGPDDTVGSEHTVDGVSYPAELHLVHFKTEYGDVTEAIKHDDGLAVLGVLLRKEAADNLYLDGIVNGLASVTDADTSATIPNLRLQDLLPSNLLAFYRYQGSLTTPTCNEVVVWTVFTNTIPISSSQLAKFRTLEEEDGKALDMNFRPVQPLNGRTVFKKPLVIAN